MKDEETGHGMREGEKIAWGFRRIWKDKTMFMKVMYQVVRYRSEKWVMNVAYISYVEALKTPKIHVWNNK